jgi:hypothetical protein
MEAAQMGGGLSQRPRRFESFPLRSYILAGSFLWYRATVQLMGLFVATLLVVVTLVGLMLWLFFHRGR